MSKMKFVLLSLVIAGLSFTSTAFAEKISIPGTGDGVAVLKSIGVSFTQKTGVTVLVPKSIGSGAGVKAAGMDLTPLARVARSIKDKEKHFGLSYMPVFLVPTAFFVHQSVTVDNLSEQQVVDIYSGKITNWKQIGGKDQKIEVTRREDKDSSLNNLRKTLPGFKDITLTKDSVTAPKTPLMVKIIQNKENSIGFGPYDVALANSLNVLKVNGKLPSDNDYPYFGTIGFVFKDQNLSGFYKDFSKFATSMDAHNAIRSAGGVPILEGSIASN